MTDEGRFLQFPEFQLKPLPSTNPRIEGVRWKQYHAALGLENIPKESWDLVKKEKADDMIHVLDFPYNGEPPRVCCPYAFFRTEFDLTCRSRIVLSQRRLLETRIILCATTVAYPSLTKKNTAWTLVEWSTNRLD